MRREIQTEQDDSEFETLLMRRFHLTLGQPEYVVVKRRRPRDSGQRSSGVPEHEAEKRAWATVNKLAGGGKLSGSGRGKPVNKAPARKGGKRGGAASAARSAASKSVSGSKAAKVRQRNRSAA